MLVPRASIVQNEEAPLGGGLFVPLVRSHPPSQSGDVCLVQVHEDLVLTHPAIACNAADETVAVVINLDKRLLAVRAAFVHGGQEGRVVSWRYTLTMLPGLSSPSHCHS